LRLLVVEDDPDLNRQLVTALGEAGYAVDTAFDGEEGHFLGDTEPYDAVVLDIGLPKKDGLSVLEQWRRDDRKMPVLILTARERWSDKVAGMDAGADDYVAKPFSVTQLLLRVQAVLRRSGIGEDACREISLCNGLVIDTENLCAGEVVFTRREMDVLVYLSQQPERPVSREELLARVWGYANHMEIETRTVDIHIAKLRRKIEVNAASPEAIVTVRGAGYRLMIATQ